MTVNIVASDISSFEGAAFSLTYPGNVLSLESEAVTTSVFEIHRDDMSGEPGMGSFWSSNTENPGTVFLTGIFKQPSALDAGSEPLTLFTVVFRVKSAAPAGIHSMRLFQSRLCNGPAGWGTDNNNNGVFNPADKDLTENVPLLYLFGPDSGAGRDDTDGMEAAVVKDGFDEQPLFVFNVLGNSGGVTPPDDDPGMEPGGDDNDVNPVVDSDNDGVPDNEDECPDDPLKTEPGACGCGVADADSDEDGIPDCHDVLIGPANGAIDVSLNPVMEIEPFPGPDTVGPDAVIVWQISTDSTFTNLLFEYTGPYDVTEIQLPDLILDAYTTYYWRIRYDTGPWETAGEFTTGADPVRDDDGNGVPDDQDVVNGNIQTNLIDAGDEGLVLQSRANGLRFSLAADEGVENIERFRWAPAEDFKNAGFWPVNFTHGLLSFRLKTAVSGATVTITIGFSEKMTSGSQWWKTTVDQSFYDFSGYAVFAEGMRSLTLTLTDGGPGDLDGVANGVIIDPGGIVAPETGSSSNSSSGGGGGSSGCFIGTCVP